MLLESAFRAVSQSSSQSASHTATCRPDVRAEAQMTCQLMPHCLTALGGIYLLTVLMMAERWELFLQDFSQPR